MDPKDLNSLGCGIAFGYYFYLKDAVFKGDFCQRILDFEDFYAQTTNIKLESKKVFILVPELCEGNIALIKELELLDNMNPIEKDVVGTKRRPYMSTVYKSLEKYYIIDIAQCLNCIYVKQQDLNNEQKMFVINQFRSVLCFLLSNDVECKSKYEVLTFKEGDKFSDVLKHPEPKTKSIHKISMENLGKGLAYWFYHNYIVFTESDLRNQIKDWQLSQKVELENEKVFILVPYSCYCPSTLTEENDLWSITYAQDLNNNKEAPQIIVGASYNRTYRKSVLLVTSKNKRGEVIRKIYCLAEFASPIHQLYRMYNENMMLGKIAIDSNSNLADHRNNFVLQLGKLLEPENLYDIINYDDEDDNISLTQLLLQMVETFH